MPAKRTRLLVLSDEDDDDEQDFEIVEARSSFTAPITSAQGAQRGGAGARGSQNQLYETEEQSNGFIDEQTQDQIREIDDELESIREQVEQLLALEDSLKDKRAALVSAAQSRKRSTAPAQASSRGSASSSSAKDYTRSDFAWSKKLKAKLKDVWGYTTFRFCQEAVCNAALDGRDAVVIMPTGSGKSICYQLPALLSEGLTVVVSPLISLMLDQVLNLREVGVDAELLSAAVPRSETAEILKGIREATTSIKLLYVTPERVAKSKTLMSALQKAYERGNLSHIVIDEAHCAASMGHDYRPDYKGLSIFRKVFPEVPLQMLTATCGPKVLDQVLQIMGVKPTTAPNAAAPNRTLLFQAPLYRPNLVYSVLPRPAASNAASQTVVDWIVKYHRGQSGIVYCLSKKDTENMAQSLNSLSNGAIRAAVYHADLDDTAKTNVHMRWRQNKVQVVCATIAFGMGIDKPDVRFVIHACISKSIEGLYQESGRAGRDGKDADCVLFYRSQDATRISSLVAGEPTGAEKVRAVLEYVQSERCRKIIFGEYFADTSGGQERCGRCDNCVNPPTVRDLTFAGWQVLKVAQDVQRGGGRLTLAQLADLARGLGGGRYTVSNVDDERSDARRSKGNAAGGHVDLSAIAGGKVNLNKEECERLVVGLLIKDYLQDEYHYTAYAVNVYVQPGPQAIRLTRLTLQQAQASKNLVAIAIPGSVKAANKPRESAATSSASASTPAPSKKTLATPQSSSNAKGKKRALDFDDDIFDDIDDDDDEAPLHESYSRDDFSDEDDDELAALLDAEVNRRRGDAISDDDDESSDDENHEPGRDQTRTAQQRVVHEKPVSASPPIRQQPAFRDAAPKPSAPATRPAAVPRPAAASTSKGFLSNGSATGPSPSVPSSSGLTRKSDSDGPRKRFRPYIPPSSSSGSSMDLLRPGALGSSSSTMNDDDDDALFAGVDPELMDDDGWEFKTLSSVRGRAGR